jgi:hypothetical protein
MTGNLNQTKTNQNQPETTINEHINIQSSLKKYDYVSQPHPSPLSSRAHKNLADSQAHSTDKKNPLNTDHFKSKTQVVKKLLIHRDLEFKNPVAIEMKNIFLSKSIEHNS